MVTLPGPELSAEVLWHTTQVSSPGAPVVPVGAPALLPHAEDAKLSASRAANEYRLFFISIEQAFHYHLGTRFPSELLRASHALFLSALL